MSFRGRRRLAASRFAASSSAALLLVVGGLTVHRPWSWRHFSTPTPVLVNAPGSAVNEHMEVAETALYPAKQLALTKLVKTLAGLREEPKLVGLADDADATRPSWEVPRRRDHLLESSEPARAPPLAGVHQ